MPRRVFKYSTASVNPTPAFPARRTTLRPFLAVNLLSGPRSFSCYALIDSGADDCIYPATFAQRLGLEFRSGRRYAFGGVGSSGQEAFFLNIDLEIVGVAVQSCPSDSAHRWTDEATVCSARMDSLNDSPSGSITRKGPLPSSVKIEAESGVRSSKKRTFFPWLFH